MRLTFRPLTRIVLRGLCIVGLLSCAAAWVEYRVAAKLAQAQQAQAAQAPLRITFQGRLLDPDGTPVEPGDVDVLFSIYETLAGGDAKWTSGSVPVNVKKEVFVAKLVVALLLETLYRNSRAVSPWGCRFEALSASTA